MGFFRYVYFGISHLYYLTVVDSNDSVTVLLQQCRQHTLKGCHLALELLRYG
jgi:hypothetical protein